MASRLSHIQQNEEIPLLEEEYLRFETYRSRRKSADSRINLARGSIPSQEYSPSPVTSIVSGDSYHPPLIPKRDSISSSSHGQSPRAEAYQTSDGYTSSKSSWSLLPRKRLSRSVLIDGKRSSPKVNVKRQQRPTSVSSLTRVNHHGWSSPPHSPLWTPRGGDHGAYSEGSPNKLNDSSMRGRQGSLLDEPIPSPCPSHYSIPRPMLTVINTSRRSRRTSWGSQPTTPNMCTPMNASPLRRTPGPDSIRLLNHRDSMSSQDGSSAVTDSQLYRAPGRTLTRCLDELSVDNLHRVIRGLDWPRYEIPISRDFMQRKIPMAEGSIFNENTSPIEWLENSCEGDERVFNWESLYERIQDVNTIQVEGTTCQVSFAHFTILLGSPFIIREMANAIEDIKSKEREARFKPIPQRTPEPPSRPRCIDPRSLAVSFGLSRIDSLPVTIQEASPTMFGVQPSISTPCQNHNQEEINLGLKLDPLSGLTRIWIDRLAWEALQIVIDVSRQHSHEPQPSPSASSSMTSMAISGSRLTSAGLEVLYSHALWNQEDGEGSMTTRIQEAIGETLRRPEVVNYARLPGLGGGPIIDYLEEDNVPDIHHPIIHRNGNIYGDPAIPGLPFNTEMVVDARDLGWDRLADNVFLAVKRLIHILIKAEGANQTPHYLALNYVIKNDLKRLIRLQVALDDIVKNSSPPIQTVLDHQSSSLRNIIKASIEGLQAEHQLAFSRFAAGFFLGHAIRKAFASAKAQRIDEDEEGFHWLRPCVDPIWEYLGGGTFSRTSGRIRSPVIMRQKRRYHSFFDK